MDSGRLKVKENSVTLTGDSFSGEIDGFSAGEILCGCNLSDADMVQCNLRFQ